MAFTRTRAAKLLTAAEMTLFDASRARETKDLPRSRLDAKVKRARNLRDKYRDLLKRQARESRYRRGASPPAARPANERTARKAEVFEEVLERFLAIAERRQAADRKASGSRKSATRRKPSASRKAAPGRKAAARRKAASPGKAPSARKAAEARTATTRRGKSPGRKASAPRKPPRVPVRSSEELVRRKREAQARQMRARQLEVSPKAPAHGPRPSQVPGEEGLAEGQVAQDAARFAIAGGAKIQGHVAATGRRNQAKRDQRG